MDSKAQLTVDIIAKVADGKITFVNAARLLNKYRRTIERYLEKYRKVGLQEKAELSARLTPFRTDSSLS